MQRHARATLLASLTLAGLVGAAPAGATSLGPPPWTGALCPAIGIDTGCQYGIDVTAVDASGVASAVTISVDGDQPAYDNVEDATIVVKNDDPTHTLASLPLGSSGTGAGLFAFDGDGLCNPNGSSSGVPQNPPAGCPFGPAGYEGPGTSFTSILSNGDAGTVSFTAPGLAPGAHTYFSLEVAPNLQPTTSGVNDWITSTQTAPGQTGALVAIPGGTNATDTATVNGPHGAVNGAVSGDGTAAGTVIYNLYGNNTCTGPPVYTDGVSVTAGVAAPSTPAGASLPSGRYYWQVTYSGDGGPPTHNSPTTSPCGNEILAVGGTVVTTTLSATSVNLGTGVTDSAVVTGAGPAGKATGTVAFNVFKDPACTQAVPGAAETDTVTGGTAVTSMKNLPAGTYYFQASYGGDAKNAVGTSMCGAEKLVVIRPPNDTITLTGKPKINGSTGLIEVLGKVTDPGTVRWLLTFTNGRGAVITRVDAATTASKKCKPGKVRLANRCVVKTVVYSRGSKTIAAGTFTIKVKARAAIIQALGQGATLHVRSIFTFQSALGGAPGTQVETITVHGKKPKKKP